MAEKKLPKLVRKTYDVKRFRKKLVHKLHLPQDRDFLESCFSENPSGRMLLSEDINEKDRKRLAKLAKVIKKNKGILRVGRLTLPVALVIGILIFNLLFIDTILSNALSQGLERVFNAKVEVSGLNLRIFSASIQIDSISVADYRKPMINLFDAEDIHLDIHLPSLLERKLVILEMSSGNLEFSKPRSSSGALLDTADQGITTEMQAETDASATELVTLPSMSSEDVSNYIADRLADLQIIKDIDTAEEKLQDTIATWTAESASLGSLVNEIEITARQASTIRPQDFRNIEDIEAAKNLISRMQDQIERVESSTSDIVQQGRNDLILANELISGLEEGISDDISDIREEFDTAVSDPSSLASDVARVFLTDTAWQQIDRISQLFFYIERLRSVQENRSSTARVAEESVPRGGIDIVFPSMEYPSIYVGRAFSTITSRISAANLELLRINSAPKIVGEASSFMFDRTDDHGYLRIEGFLPLHDSTQNPLLLHASYQGVPVQLDKNLQSIGYIGISGNADLTWTTDLTDATTMQNTMELKIPDPELNIQSGNRSIDAFLKDIIDQTDELLVTMYSRIEHATVTELQVTTNLDQLVSEGMEGLLLAQWEVLQSRAEEELRRNIEIQMARLTPYREQLASLSLRYQDYTENLAEYTQTFQDLQGRITGQQGDWESALEEIEQRIRAQADEFRDAAEAEAQRRAAEAEELARREAAAAAAAAEERLRAEREAAEKAAREEAERVQREAEEAARRRAEEEAGQIRDRIPTSPRLPGF